MPLPVRVQPAALVTVTVYVVVEPGETVIEEVVAPPGAQLYVYVPAGVTFAVRVALAPAQILALLTFTSGIGLTVTVPEPIPAQPKLFVTVQV